MIDAPKYLPGKNVVFDDETVKQLFVEEENEEEDEEEDDRVHVNDLFPDASKTKLNSTYTEVVMGIADEDAEIAQLAQELSDRVEGVGIVSALKILAGCGMLLNERGKNE